MIELISISRLLADYFWEYKALSILHTASSLVLTIAMLFYFKKGSLKTCETDKFVAIFFLLTVISFAKSATSSTVIEFLKFTSFLFLYFAGRTTPIKLKYSKLLGFFSLAALLSLSVLAATGRGHVAWGNVSTFTGGYYFKTDLAIACLIFLTFVFSVLKNRLILTLALALTTYLVFKSNARIALPLVLIIPIFVKMALHGKLGSINLKSAAVILGTATIGMAMFALIDFRSLGMLGFDFSDPFSAANTQGRSVIWSALLHAYSNAPFMSQLFGSGLSADAEATRIFSESAQLEGVRAHNSYLYLLLCMGIMGSLAFYWLIYSTLKKASFLLMQDDESHRVIPTISCALIILFFWLSMTTEIIIRPQLMILLFFFSGLHVQSYLKVKKAMRANLREPAYSS